MIVRKSLLISSLFIFAAVFTGIDSANADETSKKQSLRFDYKALQELAHNYVEQRVSAPDNGRVEVVANNLDPRMTPKVCPQQPKVDLANNATLDSYTTIEIECTAAAHWRTYVPVRIYHYKNVVTAASPMSPGQMISESDLVYSEIDLNRVRSNVFTDMTALVGARIKKRISAGQAISASDTCLVCEGQSVTIVAQDKTLRITAAGRALADGLKGESVVVENARSNKSVQAVVTGLNEVTVNL
ncbi:MAG TPA: flagella basal body P-ring formation protein FlgA [Idiomarina abyssalis]|uniref:flagellar basal body P-ring formation chaperone FlgA n=1 Tax=Idiomarina TaxID=135575 RepID=UPI000C3A3A53|nr:MULTISPECIES: flagellar basal body P-ring formation chaperone FlgA [Idiomarina]MBH94415.1 flagella basal body P-ring formation protein FlgA [Idiomarina sp.]HAS15799.1 flagella basal body P-ring formation protein FlgA [Idiomarina abyssalis]|tara:strand:+ start:420 stop:1151 length:732 start_codon:yes stop_codon:yes gene_type:complete